MVNPATTHDVRQVPAYQKLQEVCERGTIGKPDLETQYRCILRKDYSHWPKKPASEMAVVGCATRPEGFNHLWFNLGVCRDCLEAAD